MTLAQANDWTGVHKNPSIKALFANWWRKRRIERHRLRTLRSLRHEPDWLLDDIGVCRAALEAALARRAPGQRP